MMLKTISTMALLLASLSLAAEPFKTYLSDKGLGACGPALLEDRDGNILCWVKEWLLRSTDGGRTWARHLPGPAFSSPGVGRNLYRLKDGRFMVLVGKEEKGRYSYFARFSPDEGSSWGEEVQITKDSSRTYVMNDRTRRLSSGRIVISVSKHPDELAGRKGETVGWVSALYSDDEGTTWHEGDWLQTSVADQLCEPCVFEKSDGTLVMISRTGRGYLYRCDSKDGGSTWGTERPTSIRSAVAPFCVKKDPFTGWVFVAWDNSFPAPVHQYPRSPLSLAVSRDEGDTWEFICDIEDDPMCNYGYPAIHFRSESILVAYYEDTKSRSFNPNEQRCKLAIFDRRELSVERKIREPLLMGGGIR